MLNYSTEYLIMHEDSINWEELSSNKDDFFSLVEIRLFRKRINWKAYFCSHLNSYTMTPQMFEIASKYFDDAVYRIISDFGIAPSEFIEAHPEKFNFENVIRYCNITEDALLNCEQYWKNISNIKEIFYESKYISLNSPNFSRIKLMLEIE